MRTSSKSNMRGDSQGRQLRAIQALMKVREWVSGMAPMAMRKRLQDLIKNAEVKKIFEDSGC